VHDPGDEFITFPFGNGGFDNLLSILGSLSRLSIESYTPLSDSLYFN
jgi:hypothetical protein